MAFAQIVNREDIPVTTHIEKEGVRHYIGEVRPFDHHTDLKRFLEDKNLGISFTKLNAGERHDPHVHDVDSLVIILSGAATLLGPTERKVREGDVICLPRGTPHGFHCDPSSGLTALSIQGNAQGLFDAPSAANIKFAGSRSSLKEKLFAFNDEKCEELMRSPFFQLLDEGILSDPDRLKIFYMHLRMWSDKFQKILYARQTSTTTPALYRLFEKHLVEEIGHNEMLPFGQIWDPIVDACSDWFIFKMLSLDDLEKLAVVHLVLEKAGDTYHNLAREKLRLSDKYMDLHAEVDSSHSTLGSELFDTLDEAKFERIKTLCDQSWGVFETALNRIAELSKSAAREHRPERRLAV